MKTAKRMAVVLLGLLAPLAWAAGVSTAEAEALKQIRPERLLSQIQFLSSDLLEGRGPGTRGDQLAETYIATQMEGWGLSPGAPDGSYFQPFDIWGVKGHPNTLTVAGRGKPVSLTYSKDFVAVAGRPAPESRLDKAEVIFVGYGIVAPEFQWDDFKDVDVKGKVVMMMNNDPEKDPALFAGPTRLWYGRWDYKFESAARHGAAGAIIIHTTHSAGYPWQVIQTSWGGEQFQLPNTGTPQVGVRAWVTEEVAKTMAKLGGLDLDQLRARAEKRDFRPVPLGVSVTTAFTNVVAKKRTANVLGKIPGSDPQLKEQVVLLTAHHDHLGMKENAKPGEDAIYNGAEDNASGVAALLNVARAFTSLPQAPRRTLLFAAVAAEEAGLLGSQYLAEHPPVPVGKMAANINLDGMNIWGRTKDVIAIGLGKSNIDPILKALAEYQGRTVKPDQMPDRGFFYRSDQFNFARRGVPAAYFESGLTYIGKPEGWGQKTREAWEAKDYHQPSDEITKDWDLSGAVEDVQLYFLLANRLANQDAMPEWNKGDEFEAARKKSLGAGAP